MPVFLAADPTLLKGKIQLFTFFNRREMEAFNRQLRLENPGLGVGNDPFSASFMDSWEAEQARYQQLVANGRQSEAEAHKAVFDAQIVQSLESKGLDATTEEARHVWLRIEPGDFVQTERAVTSDFFNRSDINRLASHAAGRMGEVERETGFLGAGVSGSGVRKTGATQFGNDLTNNLVDFPTELTHLVTRGLSVPTGELYQSPVLGNAINARAEALDRVIAKENAANLQTNLANAAWNREHPSEDPRPVNFPTDLTRGQIVADNLVQVMSSLGETQRLEMAHQFGVGQLYEDAADLETFQTDLTATLDNTTPIQSDPQGGTVTIGDNVWGLMLASIPSEANAGNDQVTLQNANIIFNGSDSLAGQGGLGSELFVRHGEANSMLAQLIPEGDPFWMSQAYAEALEEARQSGDDARLQALVAANVKTPVDAKMLDKLSVSPYVQREEQAAENRKQFAEYASHGIFNAVVDLGYNSVRQKAVDGVTTSFNESFLKTPVLGDFMRKNPHVLAKVTDELATKPAQNGLSFVKNFVKETGNQLIKDMFAGEKLSLDYFGKLFTGARALKAEDGTPLNVLNILFPNFFPPGSPILDREIKDAMKASFALDKIVIDGKVMDFFKGGDRKVIITDEWTHNGNGLRSRMAGKPKISLVTAGGTEEYVFELLPSVKPSLNVNRAGDGMEDPFGGRGILYRHTQNLAQIEIAGSSPIFQSMGISGELIEVCAAVTNYPGQRRDSNNEFITGHYPFGTSDADPELTGNNAEHVLGAWNRVEQGLQTLIRRGKPLKFRIAYKGVPALEHEVFVLRADRLHVRRDRLFFKLTMVRITFPEAVGMDVTSQAAGTAAQAQAAQTAHQNRVAAVTALEAGSVPAEVPGSPADAKSQAEQTLSRIYERSEANAKKADLPLNPEAVKPIFNKDVFDLQKQQAVESRILTPEQVEEAKRRDAEIMGGSPPSR